MNRIKKYINSFFKTMKRNFRYAISLKECEEVVSEIKKRDEYAGILVVSDVFDFGYVKGYRAALAEMRKGVVV